MPSLAPDYKLQDAETLRLLNLFANLSGLPPHYQKIVAEIILLRLFSLLQNTIYSISLKIACGANFLDGSSPTLLTSCLSKRRAEELFQTYGRPKPKFRLHWSKATDIKENVKYVIDQNDNFISVIDRNGQFIGELRKVRNRIAHNNQKTRNDYQIIVRRHYGAFQSQVTPGILLMTTRFEPCLLETYIRKFRILSKDLTKKFD